jgi:hypothetical protein
MPAGDAGPDRSRLLGREEVKRDRVPRRGRGPHDETVVRAPPAGRALRDDGEGLEPRFEKPHRTIVPGMGRHSCAWDGRMLAPPPDGFGPRLSSPAPAPKFLYKAIMEGSRTRCIVRLAHMRRFLLLVLGGALALAAAPATQGSSETALRTAGTVGVSLRDGIGSAAISRRGSLLARVGRGRIWITDLPGGTKPSVSCDRAGTRVNSNTVLYRGYGVSCRVFGGPWRVRMRGRNIDADGVVRGYLTLNREGAKGWYSIDNSPYRLWPLERTRFSLLD